MELTALLAIIVGGLLAAPRVTALSSGDGETMYEAFNNAFIITSGNSAYFKRALNDTTNDGTWTAAQDIFVVEDAYELTGDDDKLNLITDLLNTWLVLNPQPWTWDTWNDDIGWNSLALMRGYQFTGNSTYYNVAKEGYDVAFARGWDTTYDNGGIWELQPTTSGDTATKCVLSNFSLGRVACMIYQFSHDTDYLNQCEEIYNWVWNTLFIPSTGEVIACIVGDGTLQYGPDPYNQGLMADMANMLWLITFNDNYLRDAEMAITYAFASVTVNGIFSQGYNPTGTGWVDDLSRGTGRTVQNNRLWDTYYSEMVNNANSILANRRADFGITWNAWDTPTPEDLELWPTQVADAPSWVLWTPASQPDIRGGIHTITNVMTGQAIDSAGTFGNGNSVIQWSYNGQQNQRWLFTQNSDTSWNIINLATWEALDCPGGSDATNLTIIQWQSSRNSNQRWWVDQQSGGSYKIWNQESQLALDGSKISTNGFPLTQWPWNGGTQQLWNLG